MKIALAVLALAVAPTIAMAECSYGKHQQASSCKAGTTFDTETGACVAINT